MTTAVQQEIQLQLAFEALPAQPDEFYFAHFAPELKCWTVAYLGPHCGTLTIHMECTFGSATTTAAWAKKLNAERVGARRS